MRRLEILWCKQAAHLGLTPRDRDADAGQHVVHEDVVDVVFSDQVAHQRAVVRPGQRRPRARQRPLCLGLLGPPYAFPPDLLGLLLDVVRELTRILDGRGVR